MNRWERYKNRFEFKNLFSQKCSNSIHYKSTCIQKYQKSIKLDLFLSDNPLMIFDMILI